MGTTETTIYHAVIFASVVIGILLTYFFIVVIHTQKVNVGLRKKNILEEIAGLEKERARIAADFHDELSPLLSTVKMRINFFQLTNDEDLAERRQANDHIEEVIRRMREISFNLMPATLLRDGLIKALEEYVEFLNRVHLLRFTFIATEECILEESKAVNIYRIVQEVIHNGIKHSKASGISIEIRNKKNAIEIRVCDNGCGFDYKRKLAEKTGIGLGSISNRVMITGGKMFIDSGPQKGTTYIFEIPL
jgi:signal transduction histidine kinase